MRDGTRQQNPSVALNRILGEKKAAEVEASFGHDVRNVLSADEEVLARHMTKAQAAKVSLLGQAVTDWYKTSDEVAKRTVVRSGHDIYRWMKGLGEPLEVEQVWIAACDSKNRPFHRFMLSQGTLNASLVHPRDVFTPLIRARANSFFMVHNHPSGSPTPSVEDIEITRRIKSVADVVGIRFLDHVVMGRGGDFVSMVERGIFP